MNTPKEWAILSAAEAVQVGIPLEFFAGLNDPHEVGFLYAEDIDTGEHWTYIGEAEIVRMLVEAYDFEVADGLELPLDRLPFMKRGWPDEWVYVEGELSRG